MLRNDAKGPLSPLTLFRVNAVQSQPYFFLVYSCKKDSQEAKKKMINSNATEDEYVYCRNRPYKINILSEE